METQSFWEATTPQRPDYPTLDGGLRVDVAIIGGGITGITAAHQLAKAGKRVAVLEARRVGGGTTGWSTGNLYVPVGPYFHHIAKTRSQEVASTVAQARFTALNFIEQHAQQYSIDCHFARRPWYFFTQEEDMVSNIEKEAEALQQAGMATEFVTQVPGLRFDSVQRAVRMDGQARFHPLRYVLGLAKAVTQMGGQIYEHTTVLDLKEEEDHCLLKTTHGTVTCNQMIIATHIPIGIHSVQTVAAPYRSYVVAMRLKSGAYPDAYYWHNDKTHHAITTHSTDSMELDMLMIAGNHHKTGQASHQEYQHYFNELEAYARQHFDIASVEFRWSAQHYRSGDGVPYIGLTHKSAKRTYIATGFYADGLTYGTVAGIQLADTIAGEGSPWLEAFDATRGTNLSTAGEFIKENANVAAQYLKDIPAGQASHFSDIGPGEGKTIEVDSEKLAVYRDEHSQLHVCSAVCTHMKCIVNWNNAEKTWDCPCHGSRFMIDGSVIEGPAILNLERKAIDPTSGHLLESGGKTSGEREINNPIT
ncbi:FAD-dependent oxidoreductase [Pontibacter sp. BT731]|uniref:FAD-dependent oxidoreductase n=1 Tax=Pontibacter coccineus TaxID=3063328 RepID=UPI0026E39DBE|nr:FAD-dependent oxidoreductase [Pontibacter sp. BT731]MDO6391546.1 FAD-dependent oxidoreductase [Pontibacter sp. BT731]